MSVTVTWLPNTEPDIASYEWQRAPDDAGGPGAWTDLVTIVHDLSGPNYDVTSGRFFYVDATGTTSHWYRVRAVDTNDNYPNQTNNGPDGQAKRLLCGDKACSHQIKTDNFGGNHF
jgi:hypothetical protein